MDEEITRSNLPVTSSPQLYDHYTKVGVSVYDQMLIERLVDEYQRKGKGSLRVLDVCTGTGQLLVKVAATPELREVTFSAFDLFSNMLEIAQANIQAAGLSARITLHEADVHALPFAACEFDMTMGRSVIHHWADPVRAFREIYRVLKPGGVAVIHEPRRDPGTLALQVANEERKAAGMHPFHLGEKYTATQVTEYIKSAGIQKFDVFVPNAGLEALGFEVRFEKKTGASGS